MAAAHFSLNEEEGLCDDSKALISQSDAEQPSTTGAGRWRRVGSVAVAAAAATALLLASRHSLSPRGRADTEGLVSLQAADEDPNWGCGLVGALPGISQGGQMTAEMKRFVDGIKGSSTFNKASYWNWNLAPQTDGGKEEHLSADFIFMPENWGAGVVQEKYLRTAGVANFLDSNGKPCSAEMSTLLLGMNEPDIRGSCMGNMFGKCVKSCSPANVATNQCPAAHLERHYPPGAPNAQGECNCWQFSHATGVGFWPFDGCQGTQPLIQLWKDAGCVNSVMSKWKETARIAVSKGYKYLTTPLVAEDMTYARKFIEEACGCTAPGQCARTEASCGCPVYVGYHFYATDCRPISAGGYDGFKKRLESMSSIMTDYPFVKGAIINEVGMLNCDPSGPDPICVADNGQFPASKVPGHACPSNDELPHGLASFIDQLFEYVIAAKTPDGRSIVKGFSWFNENQVAGVYNLQLFTPDGSVNEVGEAYMRGCSKWAAAQQR